MRARLRVLLGAGVAAAMSLALPAAVAAAAPPRTPAVATTTALSASVPSSSYDSWVKFTAHVTAAAGTPTGSVTFTDKSNGSILDTATLSKGTVTFATAALAPGTRDIVARYGGDATFAASSSADLRLPVAAAGSDAVAYQINTSHSGRQATGTLRTASLTQKWSVTLGGTGVSGPLPVSYPVIARRWVFVVAVPNSQVPGFELYALAADTGKTVWSTGLGATHGFITLAYDGRRVFALDANGVLTAFAAATGHELWSVRMPGQYLFNASPTAYDGVVYVSGAGSGGTVYAVSEADGVVRWTGNVTAGDLSSPAVDDTGVYVSYGCQQDYRFNLRGHLMWHHGTSCEGGGGSTAVLHGTSVYARGFRPDTPLILSKSSETSTGNFSSASAPAFDAKNMYTLQNGHLIAVDPSGGPNLWEFSKGTLVTAP